SKSPIMAMFLEPFKAAAAEGAALELKLRLLAGTIPALHCRGSLNRSPKPSHPSSVTATVSSSLMNPRRGCAIVVSMEMTNVGLQRPGGVVANGFHENL